MIIAKQKQLIARIQADLRKEAVMLHDDGNEVAMADCDNQADALDFVIDSLRSLQHIRETASMLATALMKE